MKPCIGKVSGVSFFYRSLVVVIVVVVVAVRTRVDPTLLSGAKRLQKISPLYSPARAPEKFAPLLSDKECRGSFCISILRGEAPTSFCTSTLRCTASVHFIAPPLSGARVITGSRSRKRKHTRPDSCPESMSPDRVTLPVGYDYHPQKLELCCEV